MTKKGNLNITIKFSPHSGQKYVLENRKRFNTLNLGRRWGKTFLGQFLLMETACNNLPVGWWSPTYKDLSQVWKRVKKKLAPVIKSKSEQLKQLELVNGVVIDFWSLDDPDNGRGRKYGRVIIDEVAKVKQERFKEAWEQSIRPTLTDYIGDAYFLSTPKGYGSYWHELCKKDQHGWINFNMPTSTNPHIPISEIEAAQRELPQAIFRQEYEASFENLNSERWFYTWDEDFVLKGDDQLEIDLDHPLWISIDFNVSPCSALLFQVFDDEHGGIYFIDEIQAEGGTRALMDRLSIYKDHPSFLLVTGDSTGHKRDAAATMTNWEIVTSSLELNLSQLIDTRGVNPRHRTSREFTATAMHLDLVYINEQCTDTLNGIRKAVPDKNGSLKKDDSDNTSHYVDCFRYGIHTQCLDGREDLVELRRKIDSA